MFVDALAPGSSLSAKVQNIIDNYTAAHHSAACGTLNALINETQAQSGKHLTYRPKPLASQQLQRA